MPHCPAPIRINPTTIALSKLSTHERINLRSHFAQSDKRFKDARTTKKVDRLMTAGALKQFSKHPYDYQIHCGNYQNDAELRFEKFKAKF